MHIAECNMHLLYCNTNLIYVGDCWRSSPHILLCVLAIWVPNFVFLFWLKASYPFLKSSISPVIRPMYTKMAQNFARQPKVTLGQSPWCQNHLFLKFLLLNYLNRTALKLRLSSIFIFLRSSSIFHVFFRLFGQSKVAYRKSAFQVA